jgi:hypothetical protein
MLEETDKKYTRYGCFIGDSLNGSMKIEISYETDREISEEEFMQDIKVKFLCLMSGLIINRKNSENQLSSTDSHGSIL